MKPSLPSLDFKPKYLSCVTGWHGHLHFANDLIKFHKPSIFVELGVHFGDSYFTFCQSVKQHNISCKCIGVDKWIGDHQCGYYGEEVWSQVYDHNYQNYREFSSLLRSSFSSAVSRFDDGSIDLLHLDGLHTYDGVKKDFSTWIPKVSNTGIVLIHDIEVRSRDFGAWKFWREIENAYPSFSFSHGHGLGVLFKKNVKPHLNWYFESFGSNNFGKAYYQMCSATLSNTPSVKKINLAAHSDSTLIEKLNTLESKKYETEQLLKDSIHSVKLLEDKLKRMSMSLSWNCTKPLRFLRRLLIDPFRREIFSSTKNGNLNYQDWVAKFDTLTESRIDEYKYQYKELLSSIKISVILPVYETPVEFLDETIQSVKDQIYRNWELIIVDDNSKSPKLKKKLINLEKTDSRIKVYFNDVNLGIAKTSNISISRANGDYLVFLDHDDLLRRHSLLRLVQTLELNRSIKLIYSDEDKIKFNFKRVEPNFKPDWNPDLLLSQNYICHLVCVKTKLVRDIGGFRSGYDGCQDWDLLLRLTEIIKREEIFHIPEVLYHWRISPSSTAFDLDAKPYVFKNSLKVVNSAFERRKISADVLPVLGNNNYVKVKYNLPQPLPLVSVIIPIKDRIELLRDCVEGLLNFTSYQNFEVLICDNGSFEKESLLYLNQLKNNSKFQIISFPGEFNYSKINNHAAVHAKGNLLLFLNNDTRPINDGWLEELVSHAVRPGIGCVGAKLLYEDNSIQHAGIILGVGGVAGHAFKRFPESHHGYMSRLHLLQNYSAVTGACMLVSKKVFFEVGGFDEENLKVAFNDVDFCLKLIDHGYWNVWSPYAKLYHNESATRGPDAVGKNLNRYLKEADFIRQKWRKYLQNDPAYNPNFNLEKEDFSFGRPRNKTSSTC